LEIILKFRDLLRTHFQLAIAVPLGQATPAALAFLSQHHTNAEDIGAIMAQGVAVITNVP
jgi:hypothetical protein